MVWYRIKSVWAIQAHYWIGLDQYQNLQYRIPLLIVFLFLYVSPAILYSLYSEEEGV